MGEGGSRSPNHLAWRAQRWLPLAKQTYRPDETVATRAVTHSPPFSSAVTLQLVALFTPSWTA